MSDADVIVIGSGFAGSICADRLSHAGAKVLVLERGPWRDSLPVRSMGIQNRAPFPYGWKAITHLIRNVRFGPLALMLNKTGLFEFTAYSGLGVLSASAVGGGSHAWGAMLTPPQDPGYWRERHPSLRAQDVEAHYETIATDLGAARPSKDHWSPNSIWTQLPERAGQRCTPVDPQPYMAVQLPRTESEAGSVISGPNGVQRAICAFDGDSLLGSKGGAKATVDAIYLAPAIVRGAIVRDMCEVVEILPDATVDGAGYIVRIRDLRDRSEQIVRAPHVVLAAGAMNTLKLLYASSEGRGGLNPMPSLGRPFGANADLVALWVNPPGMPSSFNAPPVFGQFAVDGKDDPCLALAALPGVDTLPLPGFVKRWLARAVFILGMGADSGRSDVGYRGGRLRVRYDEKSEPVYDRLREAFKAIDSDKGCKTWVNPVPFTIHPWGGASLGADAAQGVIDHNGEVYGNPGLFVVDGAALPAAPATAPTMTIAAWAHYVGERLAARISSHGPTERHSSAKGVA